MNEETIKALFQNALEMPPAERAAFLDKVCEGEDAARQELEALLRDHDAALCYSDKEMDEDPPFVSTAGWGYLRLRGEDYDDAALAHWAGKVAAQDWKDAYVFFKHEDEATGPRLAERFKEKSA